MEGEKERNTKMRGEKNTVQGREKMVKERTKSAKKRKARDRNERGWL